MNSKKTILIFSLLMLLCTGCGTKKEDSSTLSEKPNKEDSLILSEKPNREDVMIVGAGIAETEVSYGSIDRLLTKAEVVIYGETKENIYQVDNGSISTTENVEVLECLYGNLEKGKEINIKKMGGYAKMEDYINSYDEEYREQIRYSTAFADLTDNEIQETYIQLLPEGEVDTDIGSRSIYFLEESETQPGIYTRIGSYEGQYAELSNGEFKIPGLETYEEINNVIISEKEDDEGLRSCAISWDEIINQIKK